MKKKTSNKIEILILAAGQSKRMRGENKLLKPLNGTPLVEHVVLEAINSKASKISIIIQNENISLCNFLKQFPIQILKTSFCEIGIGSSISDGVELIEKNNPDGILILLGDMPDIKINHINLIIDEFIKNSSNYIVRACSKDKKSGNPVLFPKEFFNQLKILKGDHGAKNILIRNNQLIKHLILPNEVAFTDLDTPEEFKKWENFNLKKKQKKY